MSSLLEMNSDADSTIEFLQVWNIAWELLRVKRGNLFFVELCKQFKISKEKVEQKFAGIQLMT